tara:strand:+ start:3462 stop:4235 length:774 start_codon:yes stop_codon:yes gene_type:complete
MKLKGGFINIKENLENVKANIKNKFIDILLSGQTDDVKQKILNAIENDERYKEINLKIDFFINKIETFMLNFIQTLTTTGLNLTSIFPIISIVGAIVSTNINWTFTSMKFVTLGYNLIDIYNDDVKPLIIAFGGEVYDLSDELKKFQTESVKKITIALKDAIDRNASNVNKLTHKLIDTNILKNISNVNSNSNIPNLNSNSNIPNLNKVKQTGGNINLTRKILNKKIKKYTKKSLNTKKKFHKTRRKNKNKNKNKNL